MAKDKPIQLEMFGQEKVRRRAASNRVLTDDICEEIASDYLGGERVTELATKWGVHCTSIYNALKRKGIPCQKWKPPTKLTQNLAGQLVEMLASGMSQRDAYQSFGLSSMTYYDWLNKGRSGFSQLHMDFAAAVNKIFDEIKPQSRGARRYALNERYFQKIDTPEKAWLLGFIAADGNVRAVNSTGILKIKLSIKDVEVLERIKHCLDSDTPIIFGESKKESRTIVNAKVRVINSGPSATVLFCSERLVSDLNRHGIHPNKTFTVKPWEGPLDLRVHYWAGVIDGDGAISPLGYRKDGSHRWQMHLVGNLQMITGFSDFIAEGFNFRPRVHPHDRIFQCSINSLPLLKEIARQFYPGNRISLRRKAILAAKVIETEQKKIDTHPITREELIAARKVSRSWRDTAKLLGIPSGTIVQLRARLKVPQDAGQG